MRGHPPRLRQLLPSVAWKFSSAAPNILTRTGCLIVWPVGLGSHRFRRAARRRAIRGSGGAFLWRNEERADLEQQLVMCLGVRTVPEPLAVLPCLHALGAWLSGSDPEECPTGHCVTPGR